MHMKTKHINTIDFGGMRIDDKTHDIISRHNML